MVIDYLLSIILGVLSSLVASLVFLLAISRLRPRVEISESIAKGRGAVSADVYSIKVVNRGRRSIVNVKACLQLVKTVNAPGGTIEEFVDIPLVGSAPLELAAFSRQDDVESYAHRFSTFIGFYLHIANQWRVHVNFVLHSQGDTDKVLAQQEGEKEAPCIHREHQAS